jgi:hypothetical protein
MPPPSPDTTSIPLRPPSPPPPSSYPPISSIPHTTPARLRQPETPSSPTVFYLAYGSNLAASTFLGVRGIRPLSRVNVSAPTLDLAFDLAGVPYQEPCFANTVVRRVPEKLPLPSPPGNPLDPPKPKLPGPGPGDGDGEDAIPASSSPSKWDKGLIGVAYEVTRKDFAHIIATEGGGAAYRDILVPCFALPVHLPSPANPEVPRPFFAHTLFTPGLPSGPSSPSFFRRLLLPSHRAHAQPSPRYLDIITTGAAEHDLPADWQAHLASYTAYTRTSRRQQVGRALFGVFFMLWFLFSGVLAFLASAWRKVSGDGKADDGALPPALRPLLCVFSNLIWLFYDKVGVHVFGDGEKTQEAQDDERKMPDEEAGRCIWSCRRSGSPIAFTPAATEPRDEKGVMAL